MFSTGHQKVILQSDQEPSIIDVKHKAGAHIPTEMVYEESPVGDSSIERAIQTIQGQIRAIKDYTERQIGATIGLDSSVLKWPVRHAAWSLTTLHVGSNGMTAPKRIRGKPFKQQIEAFGEQLLFKTRKTRATTETRCELDGRLLVWLQHEDWRTYREQHCSGGDLPQHSKAKQKKNVRIVIVCWAYSGIHGVCRTDVLEVGNQG